MSAPFSTWAEAHGAAQFIKALFSTIDMTNPQYTPVDIIELKGQLSFIRRAAIEEFGEDHELVAETRALWREVAASTPIEARNRANELARQVAIHTQSAKTREEAQQRVKDMEHEQELLRLKGQGLDLDWTEGRPEMDYIDDTTEVPTDGPMIYAITSGSYSDFQIHCVLAGEAEAEALVARMQGWKNRRYGDDFVVESYPLVTGDAKVVGRLEMSIDLYDDGREDAWEPSTTVHWPWDTEVAGMPDLEWSWVRNDLPEERRYSFGGDRSGPGGKLTVRGVDHELVRKVYGDRRAVLKTEPLIAARPRMGGTK